MVVALATVVAIDFPEIDCAAILCGDFRHAKHTGAMLALLTFSAEHRIARYARTSVCAGIVHVASDSASVESPAALGDEACGTIGTMDMRADFAARFEVAVH